MDMLKESVKDLYSKKFLGLGITLAFLSACNTMTNKTIQVSGLAFYNASDATVQNVKLMSLETGRMVSCNLVEPKSYCGTGFPTADYQGAELKLSWQDMSGYDYYQTLTFPLPEQFEENKRYAAVLKFNSATDFEAFFRLNPRPF